MLRTASGQAWLIGLLATMASFCALHAFGEQPYSVVAQSTKATAGTGRKPLGQRLAASNLPIRTPAGTAACSAQGCPAPGSVPETDNVAAPIAETAAESGGTDAPETDAATEPEEAVAETAPPATPPVASVAVAARPSAAVKPSKTSARRLQPAPSRQSLLERVKTAIVGTPRMSRPTPRIAPPAAPAAPLPLPRSLPEETAAVATIDDAVEDAATTDLAADAKPIAEYVADSSSGVEEDIPVAEAVETAVEDPLVDAVPARLEFDVRESRCLVSEGEQVVMRIAVRNVGGETAEDVHATLYFADGMEPVRAIGHTAEVFPGEVRFEEVPTIAPGRSVDLLVTAIGTRPGNVVYRGEVHCRQLPGRIAHEGSVTVRPRKPLK